MVSSVLPTRRVEYSHKGCGTWKLAFWSSSWSLEELTEWLELSKVGFEMSLGFTLPWARASAVVGRPWCRCGCGWPWSALGVGGLRLW